MCVAFASRDCDGFRRGAALSSGLEARHSGHLSPTFHIWTGDTPYTDLPAASSGDHSLDDTLDRYLQWRTAVGLVSPVSLAGPPYSTSAGAVSSGPLRRRPSLRLFL